MDDCPIAKLAARAKLDRTALPLIEEAMRRGCLPSAVEDGTNPATLLKGLLTAMRYAWPPDVLTPYSGAPRAPAVDPGPQRNREWFKVSPSAWR